MVVADSTAVDDRSGNSLTTILDEAAIAELPDDPEEMAQVVDQMTGGAGAIFQVDGFRGGTLPPRDEIRQIRFRVNSFSADNHDAGRVQVQIITRPNLTAWIGNANVGLRSDALNARNAFSSEQTPELFRRWPTAHEMAPVPISVLERAIQSTGFYHNKAKNIKACSQELVEKYDGEVPNDMEKLVALAGVGRKTANVVLGSAFGMATGIVVDTHVTRLSNRLGLTKHTDANKIEKDLMELVPKKEWIDFAHRMIHHGRQICNARKPKCDECSMNKFCPKIGVS